MEINPRPTPHALYVAIGMLIAVILAFAVWRVLDELKRIEENANKSAAATAETLALFNQALKGAHANGDDGLLVLARRLLQNADGAANAAKQTLQDANRIAKKQEPKTEALANEALATVQAGKQAVTDLQGTVKQVTGLVADLRNGPLTAATAGIESLNRLVGDLEPTAKASTALMTEATGAVTELKITISGAKLLLADPALTETLHSFAATSSHLNGMAANGELITASIRDMFRPKKTTFIETLAMGVVKGVAGPIAGSLLSHFWPQRVTIAAPVVIQAPANPQLAPQ